MNNVLKQTNYGALSTLSTVFFFWGFIAAGNSVFIPFCKNYFNLDQFQSQLIDFSFYLAYYLGALFLFITSAMIKKDIVGTWGYKKSIVIGLLFSAFGAGVMILSVYSNLFIGMLVGLFIVALGFSLQQTAANPFMILIGDESTGSNRISLGGGINSLGTTIGPLIVSFALFGSSGAISDEMIKSLSLSKVIMLYSLVGALFVLLAIMFLYSKKVPEGKIIDNEITDISSEKENMPKRSIAVLLIMTFLLIVCFTPVFQSYRSQEAKEIIKMEKMLVKQESKTLNNYLSIEKAHQNKALEKKIILQKGELDKNRLFWLLGGLATVVISILTASVLGKKQKIGWGALQYPQLSLGMLAIFVYVGVEVAIGSNLGELLKQKEFGGYSSSEIAPFVSMFWGSLMIGRWTGSINVFGFNERTNMLLMVIVPFIAFGLIIGLTSLSGYNVSVLWWYALCVILQIVAMMVTKNKPVLMLGVLGILGVAAIIIGLTTSGLISVYAFLSCGLFCSIMWPAIFSLSLSGLGRYQSQGSAFLVMMILGGAIIPTIQGKLSDLIGIQNSFFIGGICFLYLVFFAFFVRTYLMKKHVDIENPSVGH